MEIRTKVPRHSPAEVVSLIDDAAVGVNGDRACGVIFQARGCVTLGFILAGDDKLPGALTFQPLFLALRKDTRQ